MDCIAVSLAVNLASSAYLTPASNLSAYKKEHGCNKTALLALQDAIAEPIFLNDKCTDMQAYIYQFKNIIVLSCRGTNSISDIFCDLNAELVPFCSPLFGNSGTNVDKDPFVHEGMLKQYVVLERLMTPIVDLMNSNKDNILVCSSHSLGNLSCMAAIVLAKMFPNRVQYIGFGSPRVGNTPFCNLYKSVMTKTTLVKNGSDCITKIFPGSVYSHIADLKLCGHFDSHPSVPLVTDIPDHDIANYIKVLETEDNIRDKSIIDKTLSCVFRTIVNFAHDYFK
jgi:hypothetical protein